MKKLLLVAAAGVLFSVSPVFAQRVYVQVGPPPVVVEHPAPRPGPGYVWVGGYHRWDGHRYVWAPGRWVVPPRPHGVWVNGHWAHEPHGYYWVEGHWRY